MGEEGDSNSAARRACIAPTRPEIGIGAGGAMRSSDESFMRRAIEIARRGPSTSPNPRVGAVVVAGGSVVGEGVHAGPGRPHAEIVALRAAGDARGATVYVTLEPCVHHGLTPPCAPELARAGVARVVAAVADPDPRVRGRGLEHLRAAGVDVVEGVLANAARELNAAYLRHRTTGRPFVTLKLAQSLDGRISAADGTSRWITGPEARALVHARRAASDAVMVGAGTVLADDPRLTARVDGARQPARVVLDATGRVPSHAAVFARGGRALVATTDACPHDVQTAWKETGAEVVVLPGSPEGVSLGSLLDHLGREGIVELLCEGGARVATSLLRAELVDRVELHIAPVLLGAGGAAVGDLSVGTMSGARRLRTVDVRRVGDDVIVELRRA